MISWIFAISMVFFFAHGVMIPVTPAINETQAGVAFSAFYLFKVLFYLPAGLISDRVGHFNGITVALLFQIAGFTCMLFFPQYPWMGRTLEGFALAQGTISAISLLRMVCEKSEDFSVSIGRLMGLNSMAFIFGPLVGYLIIPYGYEKSLILLIILTAMFLPYQLLKSFAKTAIKSQAPASGGFTDLDTSKTARNTIITIIIGLTAAKSIAIGWQPVIGWWASNTLELNAVLSGLTFGLIGIGFALGSFFRIPFYIWLLLPGMFLLEASLRGTLSLWWPAMLLLGYWSGATISTAVGLLGWNQAEKVGRFNSIWMMITDLPMAFVPVILWEWKEPSPGNERILLLVFFALITLLALARRALGNPLQASQTPQ